MPAHTPSSHGRSGSSGQVWQEARGTCRADLQVALAHLRHTIEEVAPAHVQSRPVLVGVQPCLVLLSLAKCSVCCHVPTSSSLASSPLLEHAVPLRCTYAILQCSAMRRRELVCGAVAASAPRLVLSHFHHALPARTHTRAHAADGCVPWQEAAVWAKIRESADKLHVWREQGQARAGRATTGPEKSGEGSE